MDCVGGLNAQCDSNNKPITLADCNNGPCPEWKVGKWQEVTTSTVIVFCCCCFHVIDVTVAIAVVVFLLIRLLPHQKHFLRLKL